MMRAMWSAAAGMNVQQFNMDTISNNLANVNTTGYKKARAEFQDLLYQTVNLAGTSSSNTSTIPAGIQLGHGAKLGLVVFLAMSVNLFVAGFAGAFIPILLGRVGVDPAIASSIFVTTFTDVCGFSLLLGLASALLA